MLEEKHPEITETDLVTAFCQGEVEILTCLYDRYAPVLLGLVSRILRDDALAGAALQQTFLKAWKTRAAYDPSKCRLLTWMIMIARDTALAALTAPKEKVPEPAVAEKPDTGENPVLLSRLSPLEKAALDLVYLHGYSCAKAAEELGIPVQTLQASLRSACVLLRKETT